MKLILMLIGTLISSDFQTPSDIFICRDLKTGIFSEAPLENIEATSVKGSSVLNLGTGEVQFSIPVNSLKFSKSLMEEHFNENYMESDKYPFAKFKGKLDQKLSPGKDGEYAVTVSGELDIHGVKQQRTINGLIKISGNSISINSKFSVLCKDHKIKIPTLVFKNIAETIQVNISGTFNQFTAKTP